MPGTIQIILCGILPLTANGSLELRKEPPFRVLTPGWAALATINLERNLPRIQRVFDFAVAHPMEKVPVIIGQNGRWITGEAYCLFREPIHRGWCYTLALARYDWSTACRLGDVRKLAA